MALTTDLRTPHLRDYVDILIRRRWPITACFLAILVVVALVLVLSPKKYQAQTVVMIEQSSTRPMSIQEAFAQDTSNMEFYQTQYKIIESRTLAENVIQKLKLYDIPEFVPTEIREIKIDGKPLPEEKLIDLALKGFKDRLGVEPVRQSRLVNITFISLSPELATTVANAVAQAYVDYTLDHRLKLTQTAINFLSKRIEEQRHKLEASQLALQKYMEEQRLATFISDQYNDISAQKIADLNSSLVQAQTARMEAQVKYQQAKDMMRDPGKLSGIPDILNYQVIQNVRQRQLDISKDLAEQSQRYGPNHPKIAALRAEKQAVDNDLHAEVSKMVSALGNQYEVAMARERSLAEALENQKNEAMAVRKKAIAYGVLKREVDTNQHLYDMLLSKAKEARVSEEIDVGMVVVVDPAKKPNSPVSPKVVLWGVAGTGLAVVLSLCLGFFLEYLDDTIKFPEEVEKLLSVPNLGHIPYHEAAPLRSGKGEPPSPGALPASFTSSGGVDEAFRNLRTAITLSRAQAPPKVIVVSSAMAQEGKSMVASHLALVFATAGNRTLLVDADMRKPRQHKVWGVSRESGLSSILTGAVDVNKAILKGVWTNVDLIPSGPIPPNPSELLQSPLMAQLMTVASKHYDIIIIDSPPIMPVADPMILGRLSDGVVMVTAAGKTPAHVLKQAGDKLALSDVKVLGSVLNRTVNSRSDYYYEGYRYRYYYSYEYGGGSDSQHGRRVRKKSSGRDSAPRAAA